jgi:serine-type D-Ala-D-Ala carboxypeptidase
LVLSTSLLLCGGAVVRAGAASASTGASETFANIDVIVQAQIAASGIPGAVIEIGGADTALYRRAFGSRILGAAPVPMTVDTLFDVASLTKVVATTTAVMQLVEQGRLELQAPAARYWPEFGTAGKRTITVQDLLTHYSGLRAGLDLRRQWAGHETAMRLLVSDRALAPPRTRYVYSDANFAVLGELVQRVSGLPLDDYCDRHVFGPLGMTATRFRPVWAAELDVAPTGSWSVEGPTIRVHDPTAARMGGVAGHAGLFSTAADLARFARMLLNGGALDGARILAPASVEKMIAPHSPPAGARVRGLGWDLGPPVAAAPAMEWPAGAYGHTGYTGTMLWIDPASGTYVVVLANRTYPEGRGVVQPLREAILQLVMGRPVSAS